MTSAFKAGLWSIVRLPLQIVATGLAFLLLFWVTSLFHIPGLDRLGAAVSGDQLVPTVVAILVCAVGLSFAAFLWWVVGRFFMLVTHQNMTPEVLASLKDLPLGLPEGTVRSVLALIVAVIGLPILLFSGVLQLSTEVMGYINGIITGMFGFYFGTRSGTVSSQALNQIATAQGQAQDAQQQRDSAQADATAAKADTAAAQAQAATATQHAATVQRSSDFNTTLGTVSRQASIASTVLDVIAPALPPGLLPSSVTNAVSAAKTALDAVKGLTGDTATDDHLQMLQNAAAALTGGSGGGSALGALITKAGPMLSAIGGSGIAPAAAVAVLLSVGTRLGSAAYQRWRTRVLAAPLASGLIEFGTVTPDEAHAALQDAPIFLQAFAEEKERPGFDADLADAVLRDDVLDRLWARYGGGTPGHAALFQDRGELQKGLLQFQQALLGPRAANDIPDDALPTAISSSLAGAANPALRPGPLDRNTVNRIIGAASQASAAATAPVEAHAAFDALVTLVGHARQNNVDLATTISEVAP